MKTSTNFHISFKFEPSYNLEMTDILFKTSDRTTATKTKPLYTIYSAS